MAVRDDGLFRSQPMVLTQLYLANEIARDSVARVGELGNVQFRDLNTETSAFQRTFTQEIRRLDNVERQLNYFRSQTEKHSIPTRSLYDFLDDKTATPSTSEIDELAERSQQLETRIQSLNESYETLTKRATELTEWRWVLREGGSFFDRARGNTEDIRQSIDSDDDAPLLRDVEQANGHADNALSVMNIGFVAGTIAQERVSAFERILWRTLRGNLYMNHSEIPDPIMDPQKNEEQRKNVFVIFAHGKELVAKIRKISESMGANVYSVDENTELRREQLHEVNSRLQDLDNVLSNTKRTLDAELTQIAQSLVGWLIIIAKEKAIYQTLNRFSYDPQRKTLVAEAWCPTNELGAIKAALQDVNDRAGLGIPTIVNQIKTSKTAPTYFKTNKFTRVFQDIVDSYGTAKAGEVNPGLPAIACLPFLFACMFSDAAHGTILLVAALAMIYFEKPLQRGKQDELFGMLFAGRYLVLMFGIFAIYTGSIFSDTFSKPLPLATSQWEWNAPDNWEPGMKLTADRVKGYTYPFGLDWQWHETENDLLFSNSLKMKMSIIIGWAHMTFSLCWSYVNARHFKSPIDIWGNFVPGLIFLQSIFGYLVFCIVYKWCTDWYAIGQEPPSLLNMLINMFLQPGTVAEQLYPGQGTVQVILLLLAVIQVPIMLFLKPFYLRWEHNKARAQGYRGIGETSHISATDDEHDDIQSNGRPSEDVGGAVLTQDIGDGEHEEFEFSEVMIHQVIHTIEFCLNCVSHTASYLRLWALSLAHQQLSIVLWSMTLANAFSAEGFLAIPFIFVMTGLWFILTVLVLCGMEAVSAFLHALRLVWVESMSKHFIGEGVMFEPLNLNDLEVMEGLR